MRIELGHKNLGLRGSAPLDHSIFTMEGGELPPKMDRVVAVIEGSDHIRAEVASALAGAFTGDAVKRLPRGEHQKLVSSLLQQFAGYPTLGLRFSLSLTLFASGEVIGGSIGGARAVVHKAADGELHLLSAADNEGLPHADRARFAVNDSVVLLGARPAGVITDGEIRHTVQASGPENATAWLATMATMRGEGDSTTAVVQLLREGKSRPAVAPDVIDIRRSRLRPRARTAGMGAVALLAVMVMLSFVLVPQLISAVPLLPPTGLYVSQESAHHVELSWSPSDGATGYEVLVGGRIYHTPCRKVQGRSLWCSVIKNLDYVLAPGHWYSWEVRTIYQNQKSVWSPSSIINVPSAAPILVRPHLISPSGRLPYTAAAGISLCWSADAKSTKFDLSLSGGHGRFNTTFARSATTKKATGFCKGRTLVAGVRFSWRIGAISPGFSERWSPWGHFVIVHPPAPVPTTAPVVAVPVATVPAVTTSNTQPSTTTSGTQPSTTTSTQSSTTSSTPPSTTTNTQSSTTTGTTQTTTQSAPASVPVATTASPVHVCANPPNC